MKVLLINGSPRKNGNTQRALTEVAQVLNANEIETEMHGIGTGAIQGCIACNRCQQLQRCVFSDSQYENIRTSLTTSDGLIIGSPVYYSAPNGSLCALLDRVFYSCSPLLHYKPAAAVVVCRRGGASAAFDRLNKYFTITQMPIVSSQYWNCVHGLQPGEAAFDAEGMQIMRTLGSNMSWLLKSIEAGRQPRPQPETPVVTNFVRNV